MLTLPPRCESSFRVSPVIEAPTPELDHVIKCMSEVASEDTDGEEASYFEDGRVPLDAIEALFRAATTPCTQSRPGRSPETVRSCAWISPITAWRERACRSSARLARSLGLILFRRSKGSSSSSRPRRRPVLREGRLIWAPPRCPSITKPDPTCRPACTREAFVPRVAGGRDGGVSGGPAPGSRRHPAAFVRAGQCALFLPVRPLWSPSSSSIATSSSAAHLTNPCARSYFGDGRYRGAVHRAVRSGGAVRGQ